MIRRTLGASVAAPILLALSVITPAVLPGSPADANAPATMLNLTLSSASGSAPMTGAHVVVYFNPPGYPARYTYLPQIGAGTTGSGGTVSLALSTSAVPSADLGDIGSGDDAFNAVILAWDAAGQYDVTDIVIAERHALRYAARAGTDPATGKPALLKPASVRWFDRQFARGDVPLGKFRKASRYRYSPITPLNSAPGLHAELTYTYSKSTARQSEFELPTTAYGGVALTGNQLEATDRTVRTGWQVTGTYHRWIWADYFYVYYLYANRGIFFYQWDPDHFQGTVTDRNPNDRRRRGKPIGRVGFRQPAYNRGPGGNWAVPILPSSLSWERDSGTRRENAVGADFTLGTLPGGISGGGLSLEDLTTYASITSVSWSYRRGCPRKHVRVVWGYHGDPVQAERIMASCVPASKA